MALLKYWDGSQWVNIAQPAGVEVYEQPNQPSSVTSGAIWIDTDEPVLGSGGAPIQFDTEHLVGNPYEPSFLNSWRGYDGAPGTGRSPRFRKDLNGKVRLGGVLTGGASGAAVFQLPLNYRPTTDLSFIVNANTAPANVQVGANGYVTPYDIPFATPSKVTTWCWFDGVEFDTDTVTVLPAGGAQGAPGPMGPSTAYVNPNTPPAGQGYNVWVDTDEPDPTPEAWHSVGGSGEPVFFANWSNYGAPHATAGFFKDFSGTVHLKGLVKKSIAIVTGNDPIFTLPVGYRTTETWLFDTQSSGGLSRLDILSNGNVVAYTGANVWWSLAGISFRAEQ